MEPDTLDDLDIGWIEEWEPDEQDADRINKERAEWEEWYEEEVDA